MIYMELVKSLFLLLIFLLKMGLKFTLLLPNNGPLNKNKTIKKIKIKIIKLGVFRKKYFTIFGLINRLYFIIKSSLYIKKFLKKSN